MSDLKAFVTELGKEHASYIESMTDELDGAKLFAACGVILQQSLGLLLIRLHPEDARKVIEKCFSAIDQIVQGKAN